MLLRIHIAWAATPGHDQLRWDTRWRRHGHWYLLTGDTDRIDGQARKRHRLPNISWSA